MAQTNELPRFWAGLKTARIASTRYYEVSKKLLGWPTTLQRDTDGGELSPDGPSAEMLSEHTLGRLA
jgi:hypothetical protein